MVLQICTFRDLGFVSFEVAGIWVFFYDPRSSTQHHNGRKSERSSRHAQHSTNLGF